MKATFSVKGTLMMDRNERANQFLNEANADFDNDNHGKLKIFFGYAPGVGKTYEMLQEARILKSEGHDVVIGYIEPHSRPETAALTQGLESISVRNDDYRGMIVREFNLDAALNRNPEIILVDELAHTNSKKSRHKKRYQDILELLKAGISVYTTVNVQHLESSQNFLNEHLNLEVNERIPDYIFDIANLVKLVDLEPKDLLERLKVGKIYSGHRIEQAMGNFFVPDNLIALRELALRKMALHLSTHSSKPVERLLVCVSGAFSNVRVIRSAAQLATSFNSEFIAVYVHNQSLEQDDNQLNDNLNLARQLGAKVIKLEGEQPAIQIAEYAKVSGITKLVLGSSPSSFGIFKHRNDLVTQLGVLLPEIDEYVINGASNGQHERSWIRKKMKSVLISNNKDSLGKVFGKVIGIMMLCTIIGELLWLVNAPAVNMAMIYILGVMVCAVLIQSQMHGLVAAILAVICFNFFFTEPIFSFQATAQDLITFVLMFIVAMMSNYWTSNLKRQVITNARSVYRTEVLLETIQKIQLANHSNDIINVGVKQLQKIYDAPMIFYQREHANLLNHRLFPTDTAPIIENEISNTEQAVAFWTLKNGQEAGATTETLPQSRCLYLPIFGTESTAAIAVIGIVIFANNKMELYERNLIISILDECGQAFSRMKMIRERRKAESQAKQEKLRSNLLRGISHDLRTPLTNISGSADVLRRQVGGLSDEEKQNLYESIYNDSAWLISLVENLLAMTRLESNPEVKHEPELVDDIVNESLTHLSPGVEQHEIAIKTANPLLMIRVDARLISQVIINIVNNAIQHTPPGSHIWINSFQKNENQIQFEISNDGPSLNVDELSHLFKLFFTGNKIKPVKTQRGLGIGLALCKSIIETFGGKIWVENLSPQGVCFFFTLPVWRDNHGKN